MKKVLLPSLEKQIGLKYNTTKMIFITGVETYIGAKLFLRLADSGKTARVCPSYKFVENNKTSLFLKSIKSKLNTSTKLELIDLDFLNIENIEQALKGVDKVYHCAQFGNLSESDEKKLKKYNVISTKNLVNTCLESDISKFCFLSSFLTFPNHNQKTIIENHYWTGNKDRTAYEINKYGAEMEVFRGINEGLNAFIVNPTFTLGPGFHQFSESGRILFERCIHPKSKIGVVHIDDVVKTMQKLMEVSPIGERYILNSENIQLETLHDSLEKKIKEKKIQNDVSEFVNMKKSNNMMQFSFRSKPLFDQAFSNRKAVESLGYSFQDLDSIISSMLIYPQCLNSPLKNDHPELEIL